jgi:hypothetical protein
MLMEKPGIDKIQLTPSMIKVPPSEVESNIMDMAALLVTSSGVFPSSKNLQIAKIYGGKTYKSFQPPKLGKMLESLFYSLGLPKPVLKGYKDEYAEDPQSLQHTYLVGVADPTHSIPSGHVFVTGSNSMSSLARRDNIFVTRFPCVEASDGRMLPILQTKPSNMCEGDWDFLSSLQFGAILFADSLPGCVPLPATIASGDLDGDLYFVCWNENVFEHVKPTEPDHQAMIEESDEEQQSPWNENWFSDAQGVTASVARLVTINKLISSLFRQSEKSTDAPSSLAFAQAYKASLELEKHGRPVALPRNLWDKLPTQFHDYLCEPQ